MATHSGILAWRISMDKGAWQAAVHGVAKSVCVTKCTHTHTHTHTNNKGLSDHSGNSKGFRSYVPRMETNQKYFLLYHSSIRSQ